mgnify:CR=1 FL=1
MKIAIYILSFLVISLTVSYIKVSYRLYKVLDTVNKFFKEKENYVRIKLKESVYGNFFKNPFEPRKSNVLPDVPLVQTLIQNTELVKEIIGHLENIK